MDDTTVEKELVLRDLYYSPKTGYRSAEHLYELAQHENSNITRHFVKTWLQAQQSYSKYKKWNNPRHFRHTFVRDLGEQVQIDLVFMIKHKEENRDYQYIFMAIELLSRFAFSIPQKSKDGKTTVKTLDIFLDQFHKKFGQLPHLIQMDEGGEFLNKDVKAYLDQKEIVYFQTASKRKASVVERYNGTIKLKLLKLFTRHQNHNWIDYIDDLVHNYNTQVNRSIGIAPSQVDESNKFTIWGRLYGHTIQIEQPRFKVGDQVRVLKFEPKGKGKEYQAFYRKKYPPVYKPGKHRITRQIDLGARDQPPFSEEIFKVKQVLLGDPNVYKLYSPEAKLDILGKFYENELSLVR